MPYLLTARTVVPLDVDRVFAFFAETANLPRLMPPWLHVRADGVLAPSLAPGQLIDYRVRLYGVPVRWRTEITEWDPPLRFVDEQRRGPCRWWIHTHSFAPREDGTEIEDIVDYEPRGGWLVHAALVGPDLRRIFRYRETALRAALSLPAVTKPGAVTIVRR